MYAIEFQTRVMNGNIEVPDEYKSQVVGLVRIIVLGQESVASADAIDRLLAAPVKIEGFEPFTREEIYEQRNEPLLH